MGTKKIYWGILGCGQIAGKFAQSIQGVSDAILYAVASRSEEKARLFGQQHKAVQYYGSYEEMINDKEVDAVYVATPHNMHFDHAMMSIMAGKAVLCEKPLTVNASETKALIDAARREKTFLMEAFWTRFLPSTRKLLELIDSGIIGECRLLQADFGYNLPFDAEHRSYNPDLAGGALLDVGIYPINLAQMIFRDDPLEISTSHIPAPTGVDAQSAYIFTYPSGSLAVMNAAVNVDTQHNAWIYGSKGFIHMPDFFHATMLHVHPEGKKPETLSIPFESTGYGYEAIELMNCLRAGIMESQVMPLSESLKIMQIMDRIRDQWGLKYPGE